MVSFQCDGCQNVVKKPKLDGHYNSCYTSFTCLDCSTTFNNPGQWKGHTSCITEAEKYQKNLYKGPKKVNKCAPTQKHESAGNEAAGLDANPRRAANTSLGGERITAHAGSAEGSSLMSDLVEDTSASTVGGSGLIPEATKEEGKEEARGKEKKKEKKKNTKKKAVVSDSSNGNAVKSTSIPEAEKPRKRKREAGSNADYVSVQKTRDHEDERPDSQSQKKTKHKKHTHDTKDNIAPSLPSDTVTLLTVDQKGGKTSKKRKHNEGHSEKDGRPELPLSSSASADVPVDVNTAMEINDTHDGREQARLIPEMPINDKKNKKKHKKAKRTTEVDNIVESGNKAHGESLLEDIPSEARADHLQASQSAGERIKSSKSKKDKKKNRDRIEEIGAEELSSDETKHKKKKSKKDRLKIKGAEQNISLSAGTEDAPTDDDEKTDSIVGKKRKRVKSVTPKEKSEKESDEKKKRKAGKPDIS